MPTDLRHNAQIMCFNRQLQRTHVAFVLGKVETDDHDDQGVDPKEVAAKVAVSFMSDVRLLQAVDCNCSGNVFANLSALQDLFGVELHVECGSFGLVKSDGTTWVEWGVNARTTEQYLRNNVAPGKNCHFWLQDAEGRVFDVLQRYVIDVVAPAHGVCLDLSRFCGQQIVDGWTRDALRDEANLVYEPASPDVQASIIASVEKTMYKRFM